MGSKSRSRTSRTYTTTNVSQQGEGNVYGTNNRVTIQRADAQTLDNIARALERGVEDLSRQGENQTRRTLEAATTINADSLDAVTGTAGDAMQRLERLALEVQNGAEKGTQQAMDFVANYTEREQVGTGGQELRTLQFTAAAVAVALVGIAWASSKGGMKA
ncbi:hypothetical protein QLQ85_08845 [Halomonas sp. M4R5S39]|uniref:hypothetical protein n=1 Tax=Halomonas kalidii TaxID=3043293 RepID=UPI0024A801AA|nr:hypothetical protein [Halomonas kalidii]MDI5984897.1 hypothetical protein [Halomonas kalidii]